MEENADVVQPIAHARSPGRGNSADKDSTSPDEQRVCGATVAATAGTASRPSAPRSAAAVVGVVDDLGTSCSEIPAALPAQADPGFQCRSEAPVPNLSMPRGEAGELEDIVELSGGSEGPEGSSEDPVEQPEAGTQAGGCDGAVRASKWTPELQVGRAVVASMPAGAARELWKVPSRLARGCVLPYRSAWCDSAVVAFAPRSRFAGLLRLASDICQYRRSSTYMHVCGVRRRRQLH